MNVHVMDFFCLYVLEGGWGGGGSVGWKRGRMKLDDTIYFDKDT